MHGPETFTHHAGRTRIGYKWCNEQHGPYVDNVNGAEDIDLLGTLVWALNGICSVMWTVVRGGASHRAYRHASLSIAQVNDVGLLNVLQRFFFLATRTSFFMGGLVCSFDCWLSKERRVPMKTAVETV